MKGQPGTIAELLEDAKAIQTMLDRLDAALSAPPDDDPHWEQWTAEALDEMLETWRTRPPASPKPSSGTTTPPTTASKHRRTPAANASTRSTTCATS